MIAACLKWVDRRPEIDAMGNPGAPDSRFAGVSAADQAALEWALLCRDVWPQRQVLAITAGPAAAEAILRDALAAGADRAVRIDVPFGAPSRAVADLLAAHLVHASFVFCGDYSFDRGTGSVPAFLAGELGAAQALGLVEIALGADGDDSGVDTIEALRRVEGGRRERLAVARPAVLSVEGSTAVLRRASLRSMLGGRPIETISPPQLAHSQPRGVSRPFRPRPRVLPGPAGTDALERVKTLTAAGPVVVRGDPVALVPAAAAERIIAALEEWGYLSPSERMEPAPTVR